MKSRHDPFGGHKVKNKHSSALEVLMQAQNGIRTRQRRQGLCCAIAWFYVLHPYHDEEYSSVIKQLVLGVNNVARARE